MATRSDPCDARARRRSTGRRQPEQLGRARCDLSLSQCTEMSTQTLDLGDAGEVVECPEGGRTGYAEQLSKVENGQGDLAQAFGPESQSVAKLAQLQETYTQLRDKFKVAGDALAECQELLASSQTTAAEAKQFFSNQIGITEQVTAHTDRAKTTRFYAGG